MSDRKKIAARLRTARKARGYESATAAAEAFGDNYATYSGNENGNTTFGIEAAIKYARRYKISLDWLAFGRGRPPGDPGADKAAQLYELLDGFENWPESRQDQVIRVLRAVDVGGPQNKDTTPTS